MEKSRRGSRATERIKGRQHQPRNQKHQWIFQSNVPPLPPRQLDPPREEQRALCGALGWFVGFEGSLAARPFVFSPEFHSPSPSLDPPQRHVWMPSCALPPSPGAARCSCVGALTPVQAGDDAISNNPYPNLNHVTPQFSIWASSIDVQLALASFTIAGGLCSSCFISSVVDVGSPGPRRSQQKGSIDHSPFSVKPAAGCAAHRGDLPLTAGALL